MPHSRKSASTRKRTWIQLGVALVALALVLMMALNVPIGSASATERDDAVQRRDDNQSKSTTLQYQLEGINAELTDIFLKLEETRAQVATAKDDVAKAEAELAAAERHLETVRAELVKAEEELDELTEAVDTSKDREGELNQAVGDMARDLYRGNSTSPLQVVLSSEGTGEISSRAAAASALGRVQSKALDQVRSSLVVQENQAERQTAVTQRIADLKVEAEAAVVTAEEAQAVVTEKLASLEKLLTEQEEAEAAWNARKAEAQAQLNAADQAVSAAVADISQIDQQNAAGNVVFSNSSSSGSGSGGGTLAAGALFANPFSFNAPVTSNFGWRIHPIFGTPRLHNGTDFGAGCGTAQYATRAGVVARVGTNSWLGNFVVINHGMINGKSWVTEHGHLQSAAVSAGQSVTTNTVIGYTGTTGNSTGCHLHLNLYLNGEYVDILPYM